MDTKDNFSGPLVNEQKAPVAIDANFVTLTKL
jgi:hypothetical protein